MVLNIALVTDRTKADVTQWAYLRNKGYVNMTEPERETWLSGMKGSYSPHIDMNRVANAVRIIADALMENDIHVNVTAKNDWQIGDIPTENDLAAYLQDVKSIREAIDVGVDINLPESMSGLTVTDANNIEKILQYVDAVISRMQLTWWYCGEICCGEE